jgi:signal transduction histidine kinase
MEELRVLLVEDSEQDAELVLRELRTGGYAPVSYKRVEKADEMVQALKNETWNVVLCDHALPEFNSEQAHSLLAAIKPNIPFIIVSGAIGEEKAASLMKLGVNDYILKSNLKRLVPAIEREIREAKNREERRKAEKQLQEKELELWRSNEELRLAKQVEALKDEFIGMVSHELKNPLTVIIGALNTAQTEGTSIDQSKELIQDAAMSAEELSAMIDNLLELSRKQSNQLSLQTEPTELCPLIEAVVKKLKGRSSLHNLSTDIPSQLPPVMIDPIRIRRVLNNLIENAIKYSPKGGEVKVAVHLGKSEMVTSVSDQGIGISKDDRERLFQPFERLSVQDKYDIAGVGLGLRVCQILVEAHKGQIWVGSEPGKGSTFCFTLPIVN